jgi:hypothetical protein
LSLILRRNLCTALLLWLLVAGPSACAEPNNIYFIGNINKKSVERIAHQLDLASISGSKPVLLITSGGGDVLSLTELLRVTNGRLDYVFVSRECLSACAAFVSLVDAKVRVSSSAVIGFHGDAETTAVLIEKYRLKQNLSCAYKDVQPILELRARKGMSYQKVAMATISRMNITSPQLKEDGYGRSGCSGLTFTSSRRYWFPTSKQMRTVFHMDVVGTPCNDNVMCIVKFADARWGNHDDLVVGDENKYQ